MSRLLGQKETDHYARDDDSFSAMITPPLSHYFSFSISPSALPGAACKIFRLGMPEARQQAEATMELHFDRRRLLGRQGRARRR